MMNANRFDLLASNLRNTEALLKTLNLQEDFIELYPAIDTLDGYFAYCKKTTCDYLRSAYDQLYERLRTRGELAKIASGYRLKIP